MAYPFAAILLALTLTGPAGPPICHQPSAKPRAASAQDAFDHLTVALNSRNIDAVLASMTADLRLSYAGVDDRTRPTLDESFRKRLAVESARTIRA